MAHMVETMAYAGEVPWHGLGVPVSNDLSPEQMMVKAESIGKLLKSSPILILMENKYRQVRSL